MNPQIIDALEEVFDFFGVVPEDVEYNVGTIWFKDTETKKKMFLTIGECEDDEDDNP